MGWAVAVQEQDPKETGPADDIVFSECFSETLDSDWTWLREQAARWCIRNGALEIRVMPGLADTVENALVRQFPNNDERQSYAVEVTVTNLAQPRQQYEQAGLTWYVDGRPAFKLVKELVDGEVVIIPGRRPVDGETVQLRLEIQGSHFRAQFRTSLDLPFETAAEGAFPRGEREQISIQCYHGPPEAEHWIRFDDFRIVKIESNGRQTPSDHR